MDAAPVPAAPLLLIYGEDDFAVKQRARHVHQKWSEELGGLDHEVIDAAAGNSGEALQALGRLREALQTLPFFGTGKVVWFKDCSFLADDRTSSSAAVTEALSDLAQELKAFRWENVRLLLSAGKIDRRKSFYKTLEKLGKVESFAAWSIDDKDWVDQAEGAACRLVRAREKEIAEDALTLLVQLVGPNHRQLASEVEKLCLFVGDRPEIREADVEAIVTKQKHARAFALADALGDRDLPRLLRTLDEELWNLDRQRSVIGVLYGLISKVRVLVLLKEMVREGWIKAESDYGGFKRQLERVPADRLPQDRRYNPVAIHPFMLHRALPQIGRYTREELVRAMRLLLECNQKLVSRSLDEGLVLQQTLLQIVRGDAPAAARAIEGKPKSSGRTRLRPQ